MRTIQSSTSAAGSDDIPAVPRVIHGLGALFAKGEADIADNI